MLGLLITSSFVGDLEECIQEIWRVENEITLDCMALQSSFYVHVDRFDKNE